MSGEYGDIDSRARFRTVLGEAIALAEKILKRYPKGPALGNVANQLRAMKRFTDGRDPTEEERESIDVGLVAVRELEDFDDGEVAKLAEMIHPLAAFHEDWPTDEEAAAEARGEKG